MSDTYIGCSCDEHYGGDALACARTIASGTKTPCLCSCHAAKERAYDRCKELAAQLQQWRGVIAVAIQSIRRGRVTVPICDLEKLLGEK